MNVADALKTTTWQATTHSCAPSSHVITGVAQITIIAVRFALRSILPSRCQLRINGPNVRCSRNHRSRRLEERAKAKAATSRNGVVGNRGTTTPMAPTATQVKPVNSQMNRIPTFIPAVHHIRAGNGKSDGLLPDYLCMRSAAPSRSDHPKSRRVTNRYTGFTVPIQSRLAGDGCARICRSRLVSRSGR